MSKLYSMNNDMCQNYGFYFKICLSFIFTCISKNRHDCTKCKLVDMCVIKGNNIIEIRQNVDKDI